MRKIAWALIFALLLPVFAGCSGESAYVPTGDGLADATSGLDIPEVTAPGGLDQEHPVFTLACYEEEGFNPYLCTNLNNRMLFSLVYQGLFSVDREYRAVPILCKSMTISKDLTEFTFHLESATFSDGSYLRAEDVVASLLHAAESDIYEGRFDRISEITAVSENAVQIITDDPYENLPLLLDIPIVKASQLEEPIPVGTGPYAFGRIATGMCLQKRSNWWCRAELPFQTETIPLFAGKNAGHIRDEFEFSNLGISIADPGSASYAAYRCDYELWEIETGLILYLGCNLKSGVFANAKVRAALTYAIDRAAILQQCYNGFGVTSTLAVSPNSPYYDKTLGSQGRYDPDRFREVVESEGMQGREVALLVNKSDSVRLQAARKIATMLEEAGLKVRLEDWSSKYYREKLKTDEYDLYLGQTKLSATMDLGEFFHTRGALSYGDMDDAACYAMSTEALENSGNFYNLHQLIRSDGQLVPVLFRTYAVYARRGLVDHFSPARDNVFYYTLGKNLTDITTIDYGNE